MRKEISRRELLHTVAILAVPAMIEQALQTVVQYVDTAMVGRLGVHATAAVGLTSTVTWLALSPLWSMSIGFLAVLSRASGAGDEKRVRQCVMQAIWMSLLLGTFIFAVTELCAPRLPRWLNAEQGLWQDGSMYFAVVCAPALFRALSVLLGSCLRASGDTRTPMRVNLTMNVINLVLNALLIFPTRRIMLLGRNFAVPGAGMGVLGAAIATAVSIVFSGIAMLMVVLRSPTLSPLGMKAELNTEVMGACVRIGLPVAAQNIGVFGGHVVFASQVPVLGATALAAHSIALTAEQAVYIPGYGMQAAASTLSGRALGERDEAMLDRYARAVLIISMSLMTLTGAFLFAFPKWMMSLFTRDPAVIAAGATVLRIVACSEPIYSAMIILEGVFHGVGQTRYPFIVALCTMWGVRVLGTVLCVRVFSLGLIAVWLCMIGDNVSRAALLAIRFRGRAWKEELDLK